LPIYERNEETSMHLDLLNTKIFGHFLLLLKGTNAKTGGDHVTVINCAWQPSCYGYTICSESLLCSSNTLSQPLFFL